MSKPDEPPCRRTTALLTLAVACALAGCAHLPRPQDAEGAEDGVGIAYGSQASKAVTGAVAALTEKDFNNPSPVRVEELLKGRVAGVQVLPTRSGGFSVRIRGVSSIYGSNEPLYVIDGVPVHVQPGQGLDWLNPYDVARIEVLKDASATAMYGMRGANGVVLITTKRAR